MSTYPRNLQVFWVTLALFGCATLLGVGLLLADVNTRRITFGDTALPYSLPNLSAWWERAAPLCPAPLRALSTLFPTTSNATR